MLQKGFFLTDSYNRAPYWNGDVLINLFGPDLWESDTKFFPGHYRIELAPGIGSSSAGAKIGSIGGGGNGVLQVVMSYDEVFYDYFIVRAYCGGNAADRNTPGVNPYTGSFKVNGQDGKHINSSSHGEDVNHIFGAGGGAMYEKATVGTPGGSMTTIYYRGGGPNCLGDGNLNVYNGNYNYAGGAGTCVHILPVGGVFGTDYWRAYHIAPSGGGSAYGGGAFGRGTSVSSIVDSHWETRGGNSPYGTGGTSISSPDGTGIGAGLSSGCAGAYFDGTNWNTVLPNSTSDYNSFVKMTYLGPLQPGD